MAHWQKMIWMAYKNDGMQMNFAQTLAYAANNLHDHDEPPAGEEMENVTPVNSRIEHIKIAQQFIKEISEATLDNGNLDAEVTKRLRKPQEESIAMRKRWKLW